MIYIDTSVAIAYLLKEQGSEKLIEIFESDTLISSGLFEAEFLAICKRESVPNEKVEAFLNKIKISYPTYSLKNELDKILDVGYCRGADLYHIACALDLDSTQKHLEFFTLDLEQKKAAQAVGFKVVTL